MKHMHTSYRYSIYNIGVVFLGRAVLGETSALGHIAHFYTKIDELLVNFPELGF